MREGTPGLSGLRIQGAEANDTAASTRRFLRKAPKSKCENDLLPPKKG